MTRRWAAGIVGGAVLTLVAACAPSAGSTATGVTLAATGESTRSPSATTSSTTATATPSSPVTPNAALASAPTGNVCRDGQGEVESNDLTTVTLAREGASLKVVWNVTSRKAPRGVWLIYRIWMTRADGALRAKASVQYLDGQQAHYEYITSDTFDVEIKETAAVTPTSVTGIFPLDKLGIGTDFTWRASTEFGNTGDWCPRIVDANAVLPELRFAG